MLNFYAKYSKDFVFVPKTVEKYLFMTWNIWKVPNFKTKHFKHLKSFVFVCKTFQTYLVSFQNIWKISSCHPKELKSISFMSKMFKTYQNSIADCVILVQKTREILNFYAKHSIKVVFCKDEILGTSDSQNIWKVCNLRSIHSKSVESLSKTIAQIHTCNSITRKVFVSHFVSKHSKSIWFWNKTFEKHLILLQNIQK